MNSISKFAMVLAAFPFVGMTSVAANASDGVKVEHLGTNNTLVRIDGDSRYLMLPVQEAYDDATVNVVVDGKIDFLLVANLSRLGRDVGKMDAYLRWLEDWFVEVVCADGTVP